MAKGKGMLPAAGIAGKANAVMGEGKRKVLNGTEGNDYLEGVSGQHIMRGRGGDDILVYDRLDRVIDGGSGNDTLQVLASDQTLSLSLQSRIKNIEAIDFKSTGNTLSLTSADIARISDTGTLTVTGDRSNLVNLESGWQSLGLSDDMKFHEFSKNSMRLHIDARMQVMGIDDLPLLLGDGDQTWTGDANNPEGKIDYVLAGDGNDSLTSFSPGAMLFGEAGNDSLSSTGADSTLDGGAGDDTLSVNQIDQTLIGGSGIDTLRFDITNQSFSLTEPFRLSGIEALHFSSSGNSLTVSADDIVRISDNDTMVITGVAGNTIQLDPSWQVTATSDDNRFIEMQNNDARLKVENTITISGIDPAITSILTDAADTWEGPQTRPLGYTDYVFGRGGDDVLATHTASAKIYGEAGNDQLTSSGENSMLYGGDGFDRLAATNDAVLYGDAGFDVIIFKGSHTIEGHGGAGQDIFSIYLDPSQPRDYRISDFDWRDGDRIQIYQKNWTGVASNDNQPYLLKIDETTFTLGYQPSIGLEGVPVVTLVGVGLSFEEMKSSIEFLNWV